MLFFAPIGNIWAEELHEKTLIKEFELRLGGGAVCGSCVIRGASSHAKLEFVPQIFADFLIPIWTNAETARWFGIGPYVKASYLDSIPQIAGGIAAGYRFNQWQILVNAGIAYSIGRPGADTAWWHNGQTRGTYDLGLTVRRDIVRDSVFISASYNHSSNGREFGINGFGDNKILGTNPGYDSVLIGIGMRF